MVLFRSLSRYYFLQDFANFLMLVSTLKKLYITKQMNIEITVVMFMHVISLRVHAFVTRVLCTLVL